MSFRSASLIFNRRVAEAVERFPLVVADIGARSGLVEPWQSVDERFPNSLHIIGFEPDAEECDALNAKAGPSRKFFPYALWNEKTSLDLYLAEVPSTSSIHPPRQEVVRSYRPDHWQPRNTARKLSVPAVSLDELAAAEMFDIDFLKIDTQGAEYEIIDGGRETFGRDCFGCTCENWNVEIHSGQKNVIEVIGLMRELGFRVFDLERSALWRRDCPDLRSDRPELVGVDVLFFREPDWVIDNYNDEKLFKAALIADVWGFRGLAFQLLGALAGRQSGLSPLAEEAQRIMKRHWAERISLPRRLEKAIDRVAVKMFGAAPKYPPIH
jgi:FkbM family methyltransferase